MFRPSRPRALPAAARRARRALALALCLASLTAASALAVAIPVSPAAPLVETFDGIGATATAALPADFRVDKRSSPLEVGTYAAALAATERVDGESVSTMASNGIYNFGAPADASSDRAVGFLSSGSATRSGNLYAKLDNTSGQALSGLTISYDVEKYRNGSNASGFRVQLYYSLDDATYTSAGASFQTTFAADANNNGCSPAPCASQSVSSQALPVSVPAGATLYLAWNYSVASGSVTSNAQALGIDNISILGTPPAGDAPPTVTATSPTNGATDVAPGANLTVTFSEPVTLGANAFTLSCASGARTVTVSGGPTTFTLDPETDLATNEQCTLTIVAGQVTDQDGTPDALAADVTVTFTTAASADAAPTVTTTTPANGATSVARNANLVVNFSEAVAATSSSFALRCGPDAGALTARAFAAPVASNGNQTYTLDPTADFAGGEVCELTVVAAQVTDQDGAPTPMASDVTIAFAVVAGPTIRTIGEVQGATTDAEDGGTDRSPFAPASGGSAGGTTVTVQGVVYQKTLARVTVSGNVVNERGFFLQNTLATRDGEPLTSDGIFVSLGTSGATTIPLAGGGAYTPTVGDEIVLSGRISENFSLTRFSAGLVVEQVVRTGVNLETELETFEASPPTNPANPAAEAEEVERYWERREGMRARVVAGSIASGPTTVFAGTADGEIRVIHPNHPVAQRPEPYARRTFRDPHPLDDYTPPPFDNGNPYRILLGSFGIKETLNDPLATIAPDARTLDVLSAPLVGGVYFAFSKYSVQVTQQPAFADGPDPALNGPPGAPNRAQEYSVATFNVENLYDRRDDPFDGCDFTGNLGCPGVSPPFDYVPATQEEYDLRLGWLASQIVDDLKAPDILLIQEAEDQDICTVAGSALACGNANNADGKPDTLQELALRIKADGGPDYDAAYDRDGADARGIVSAFLYRTDRVQLLPAQADDPVLGGSPAVQYRGTPLGYNADVGNPKALNAALPNDVDTSTGQDGSNVFTRAPQVGLFRIYRQAVGTGDFVDAYLISNHFSSGPDRRAGQRREQAAYNAAIFDALEAANPNVRVAIGGDFNVYPRPDDPFPPGDPRTPKDQLGPLYDAGLDSLYDVLLAQDPDSAYSYVFDHQAQVLDQIFVSDPLRAELVQVRVAHINADWPRDFPVDGPRGVSDHDPSVARFAFPAPPDQAAPTTTATTAPAAPNGQGGWFTSDVVVTLTAADGQGGAGVKEIVYSATGAQPIAETTVSGSTAQLQIAAEGTTTIAYFARDNAGNAEAAKTLTIQLDKTAPAAQNDQYTVTVGAGPFQVGPGSGVLANDQETVSGPVTAQVVTGPTKGQLTLNPDGSFAYAPQAGASGTDTFTYGATNAAGLSAQATVTLTLASLPPAQACDPQPRVRVDARPNGGRLIVTVTTSPRNTQQPNPLARLDFGTLQNGRVFLGNQAIQAGQRVTLPANQTTATFVVERITPGQATTVPFTVADSCGEWPTFVGGGPNAF